MKRGRLPFPAVPLPASDALDLDERWVAVTSFAQMRSVLDWFLQRQGVAAPSGSPLARWINVLDEAHLATRDQLTFITSKDESNLRKTHDVIEARRLAWSLTALYGQRRREPDVDGSFVTRQLLGADDPGQPDPNLRMPNGTFIVYLAARLQQAEAGEIRICGNGSKGVDLTYRRGNGGLVLIEHKERAYYESRRRTLPELVRDVGDRVHAAASGLQAVTASSGNGTGAPLHVGARVVVVGTATTNQVGHAFRDGPMPKAMSRWQLELSARGPDYSPHAMLIVCMAHDIEPTTTVSAMLGSFIDFHLVGGGPCDEQWRLVAPVFHRMLPSGRG